jgi:UDP-3-O-[3-hydroxymyristoyl] glucosamine N-acyltransferase
VKLSQIQNLTKAKLEGDGDFIISSIAALPQDAKQDQLAVVFQSKFAKAQKIVTTTEAKALIVSEELANDKNFRALIDNRDLNLLIVARPKFALKFIVPFFARERFAPNGVHASAFVEESAKISDDACLGAFVYIGPESQIGARSKIHPRVTIGRGVVIGEDCEIKSGVVIEDYVKIGNRVIIQPNAVIGADGYSYITEEASNLEKLQKGDFNFLMDRQIQHKLFSIGSVEIHDDVEIGSGTCVDRGNIANTIIGAGSKIDNLCQIAHNVKIGKDCLIVAKVGIAGSAIIGDRVTMAGCSGCGDGVEIGNDAVVGAFSAANSDVDPFMPVLGAPAIAYGEFMKRQRAIARLPRQQEEFRKLKSQFESQNKA